MKGHILVVNSEHPRLAEEKAEAIRKQMAALLGELSGIPWVMCHFTDLCLETAEGERFAGVILSGCRTEWSAYTQDMLKGALAFLRNVYAPVLGICGGHQMLGMAHGARLGPMRELAEGEADSMPSYQPGMFKEAGYIAVRRVKEDALFEGLPQEMAVKQSHYFQVAELPMGFELLASSDECRVQAMKKLGMPVYGVQFHPEVHDEAHPHGRQVIDNFLRMCGA